DRQTGDGEGKGGHDREARCGDQQCRSNAASRGARRSAGGSTGRPRAWVTASSFTSRTASSAHLPT
ncbi:hypothetical protein ACWEPL_26895, partial [Nonomuraea sp. NPDC004186]